MESVNIPEEIESNEVFNISDPTCVPAGIFAIGSSVPEEYLSNDDLEKMVDTNDEWITTRTGIKKRHIAPEGTVTSDLATAAGKEALDKAGMSPEEVEMIIVATITPDMPFPSTACFVQDKIGARNIAAFDISAGCSGFVYALATAAHMVGSGAFSNALVIGVEVLSRWVDYEDRNTCVLFGDGAGAAVVKPVKRGSGVISYALGADGGAGELLMAPAGGSRYPASHKTVDERLHYIKMNGREVFAMATRKMSETVEKVMAQSGYSIKDMDCMIPHQANRRIVQSLCTRLDFPIEKAFMNIHEYGNTSAASIPLALADAERQGFLKKGDLALMPCFGTGMTWGAMILRWGESDTANDCAPRQLRNPDNGGGN
ncbi:MAG: ketoacyl-ACP synthase III [Actinobacteria bacterium]|nr:ketoacyl-ACP synthase III [Actinomycetota bacterium]